MGLLMRALFSREVEECKKFFGLDLGLTKQVEYPVLKWEHFLVAIVEPKADTISVSYTHLTLPTKA